MAEELDPQWEITVSVPHRLPVEMRQDLFEAVAQAVARWEPVQRDGWDADVFGCPARDRLSYRESQELLWLHAEAVREAREQSNNADQWCADMERAEGENARLRLEVSRLRREVEFEALGEVPRVDGLSLPVCACPTPEQLVSLQAANEINADGPQWSPPSCAVHPDGAR